MFKTFAISGNTCQITQLRVTTKDTLFASPTYTYNSAWFIMPTKVAHLITTLRSSDRLFWLCFPRHTTDEVNEYGKE